MAFTKHNLLVVRGVQDTCCGPESRPVFIATQFLWVQPSKGGFCSCHISQIDASSVWNVPKKSPAIKGIREEDVFAGFLPSKQGTKKLQQFLPQSVYGYLQSLERWPEITFQIRSAIWTDSKPTSMPCPWSETTLQKMQMHLCQSRWQYMLKCDKKMCIVCPASCKVTTQAVGGR